MKVFSSMHNPKTKRYTTYYLLVLITVTISVAITTLYQQAHLGLLQNIMLYFEGFFALFMLSRSDFVSKNFMSHLSNARGFIGKQLTLT